MYHHRSMLTTIDIPDHLLVEAKQLAAERHLEPVPVEGIDLFSRRQELLQHLAQVGGIRAFWIERA